MEWGQRNGDQAVRVFVSVHSRETSNRSRGERGGRFIVRKPQGLGDWRGICVWGLSSLLPLNLASLSWLSGGTGIRWGDGGGRRGQSSVKGRHVGPDKDSPAPGRASPIFCSIKTNSDVSMTNFGGSLCRSGVHLLARFTSPLVPLDPPRCEHLLPPLPPPM